MTSYREPDNMRENFIFLLIIMISLSLLCCTKDEDTNTTLHRSSEAIQYLIDEPVSMLDWGLYKINKELDDYFSRINEGSVNELSAGIDYNIAEEKIQINLIGRADNLQEAKEVCIININRIREMFGINTETGEIDPLHRFWDKFGISEEIKPDFKSSFLHSYFEHSGWNKFAEDESYEPIPDNLRQELDAITTIYSIITYKNSNDSSSASLVCRADLVGKKILGMEDLLSEPEVIYE